MDENNCLLSMWKTRQVAIFVYLGGHTPMFRVWGDSDVTDVFKTITQAFTIQYGCVDSGK